MRLVVLFGGQSAEHDVSCVSARHVLAAANPDRYIIEPVGITRDGRWVRAEAAAAALGRGSAALPDHLTAEGSLTSPMPALLGDSHLPAPEDGAEPPITVVFPVLHGPMGEDGTVQGLLELAGLPYVGTGVLGSAVCMDKAMAKDVFARHGIPQVPWRTLRAADLGPGTAAALVAELGLPLFVKPANLGSSVGVSKATDLAAVTAALELAAGYDEWLVVEEGVQAREIECAVLGNEQPEASLPGEIVPAADFYDYADKYLDGSAELLIPAPLDPGVTEDLRSLAIRAYQALRCEGLARVDFFYEEGGRGLLVNEINTMPGFTPISMYPKMWDATGVSYPELIDRLVDLAIERHQRRSAHRRTER
ncbi:MAG: D-alanine--D-alanine ligase [Acidimicrobiales bacterium]|nr:D-alanine--D-alanine ligase [Acidimicrobiales bacterium]